jgi:nucleoside diphosphate kinase
VGFYDEKAGFFIVDKAFFKLNSSAIERKKLLNTEKNTFFNQNCHNINSYKIIPQILLSFS